jgi:4-aminobutyrate aminotransferase-like enzyme
LIGHVPGAVSENIIRLVPPLTTTASEAGQALDILSAALAEVESGMAGNP